MAFSRTPTSWTPHSRTGSPGTSSGWYPVARSSEVGTVPVPVGAAGRAYVVVRLRPGDEVTALSARCPHRLVPLDTATVVDGRLRCPHHGWQFNAEGRCVLIPSLGEDGTPPPRADLSGPWAVEERDGWVWLAPDRTPAVRPPRTGGTAPTPEPVPAPPPPAGPVLDNLAPALAHAWHPFALAGRLAEGGYAQVRLLGRTWTVHRRGGVVEVDPPAWGARERHGVVWLAPAHPRDELIDLPETTDDRFTAAWLPPVRSVAPAGPLADAFLDGAHSSSGPAGTGPEPPHVDVDREPGGFTGVRVAPGHPPHRATYRYRAPFALLLRLEGPGAVRTVLLLLQPEDADSTRVYSGLLLPTDLAPDVVAAEVATETRLRDEDLALTAGMRSSGLPLLLRDELHVRADRLGVELRRALADLVADGTAPPEATGSAPRAGA
jgi:nitrite reductase/ring-hydroxylating ferredoxin subunit